MTEDAIARAEVLVGLGRPEEAAALLSRALADEPNDVELMVALGLAQIEFDEQGALETARRALAIDPENVQALLIAGGACLDLNYGQRAVPYAHRLVELVPWLPAAHATMAMAVGRGSSGRKDGLAAANRAIELAPRDTIGYLAAGAVELAHGESTSAIRWYEKALEIDPHDHSAQVNLVTARESAGHLSPALIAAAAILRIDPRDETARHALDETVYTTLVHLLWISGTIFLLIALVNGVG
ncbi:MAG: tetratricopeptide repeat protein [Actinomycetota bacterium]|nr:tetratricopeptide repeat protein [Actinomycetota bacterium]